MGVWGQAVDIVGVVAHIELSIIVGGGSGQQANAVRMKSGGMKASEDTAGHGDFRRWRRGKGCSENSNNKTNSWFKFRKGEALGDCVSTAGQLWEQHTQVMNKK